MVKIGFTIVDNMCNARSVGLSSAPCGRFRPQEDPCHDPPLPPAPCHVAAFRRSFFALSAVLLAGACGSSGGSGGGATPASASPIKLKVGVIPIVDVAPIYLGIKQGFFAAQGLDLSLATAQGGAAIVPGIVSGQYQFGFSNATSLLLANSQGLPLKVVASGDASTGVPGKDFGAVIVKAGSPIKTAADLAGKRVAVNTLKNINTTTINKVVRDAGGDPRHRGRQPEPRHDVRHGGGPDDRADDGPAGEAVGPGRVAHDRVHVGDAVEHLDEYLPERGVDDQDQRRLRLAAVEQDHQGNERHRRDRAEELDRGGGDGPQERDAADHHPDRDPGDHGDRQAQGPTAQRLGQRHPEIRPWTGIILLGLIGVALSGLFRLVEHRALAWYRGLRQAEREV